MLSLNFRAKTFVLVSYLFLVIFLVSYSLGRDAIFNLYGILLIIGSFSLLLLLSFLITNARFNFNPLGLSLYVGYYLFILFNSLVFYGNYKHLFYGFLPPVAWFLSLLIITKLFKFTKKEFAVFFCNTTIVISLITFFVGLYSYLAGGLNLGPFSIVQTYYPGSGYRLVGWWGSPNATVSIFAVSIIASWYLKSGLQEKSSFLLWVNIAIMLVGIILTGSRGGLLAFLIAAINFFMVRNYFGIPNPKSRIKEKTIDNVISGMLKKLALGVIAVLLASYTFRYVDYLAEDVFRVANIERSLNMEVVDRPYIWFLVYLMMTSASTIQVLFGHGPQYFMIQTGHSAHNDYLSILTSYGLLVLLFWLVFITYTYFYSIKNNKLYNLNALTSSVVLYLFVKGMFNHTFPGYGLEGTIGIISIIIIYMNYEKVH